MKTRRIKCYVCLVLAVAALLFVLYCYVPWSGNAKFSDEFINSFDLSRLSGEEIRERAMRYDSYRVDTSLESDGKVSSWSLYMPGSEDYLMEMAIYEDLSFYYYDGDRSSIVWSRVRPNENFRDSSFFRNLSKAKYRCEASIDRSNGWVYISTWGNSIDECVEKIESQLLKIYSDLLEENEMDSDDLFSE